MIISNTQTKKLYLIPGALMGLILAIAVTSFAEEDELDSDPRAIPYNGILEFNGATVNGNVDLEFTISDDKAEDDPDKCTFTEEHDNVAAYAGRFAVNIGTMTADGVDGCVFDANAVYIAIGVRNADANEDMDESNDAYTALSGRQRIRPVPFSYWSAEGSNFKIDGTISAGNADVTGQISAGSAYVTGDSEVDGNLSAGSVDVTGNLSAGSIGVTGDLSAASATITGNLNVEGFLAPKTGSKGINWPNNAFGGTGDDAWIEYISESGENAALRIGIDNDPDDDIQFYQDGAVRMSVTQGRVDIASNAVVDGTAQFNSTVDIDGRLTVGSESSNGIFFDSGSDSAWIRFFVDGAGEDRVLQIGIDDNGNDNIAFVQNGEIRLNINNSDVNVTNDLQAESNVHGTCAWTSWERKNETCNSGTCDNNDPPSGSNYNQLLCPNGRFVAGIDFTHDPDDNETHEEWYRIRCCEL